MCKLAAIIKCINLVNNPNLSWDSWRATESNNALNARLVKPVIVEDKLEHEVDAISARASTDDPCARFRAALLCIRTMIQ